MTVVSVTANNTRIEDSESTTGWTSRGGGAGAAAEAPLAYQGTNTVNRKVTSSTGAGFTYTHTSTTDMTATATSTWMVKHIVSDAGGLRSNDGLRVYVGDGTNEYAFVTAGTDSAKSAYDAYLLRTATIIVPVDPNVVGYRDSTHSSGTPSLTAIEDFAIEAEFAIATAKAENVGLDAIDLGTGLSMTGGGGADPSANYTDLVNEDEGITTNRWGFANSIYGTAGVLFFFGGMSLGSSGTAIDFEDNTSQILWPDGLYAAGFSNVTASLENASTTITDGCTHTSLGTTAVENTKADYTWVGTAGTGVANHTLVNFRNYTMTSAVLVDNANIDCENLTQASGTIQNSVIRGTSASGIAVCDDADFNEISSSTFIQGGSGHMFEITTAGTYDFTNLAFEGFGADGTNSASVYNNSGGAITINNSGSTGITVRNGASATTTVASSITLTLTGLENNTEVRVYEAGTTTEVAGQEDVTTGTFSASISVSSVDIVIFAISYEGVRLEAISTVSDITLPIQQRFDRNFNNPV